MSRILRVIKENIWCRKALVLSFHALGIVLSIWLAFQLRFDFELTEKAKKALPVALYWGGAGFFLGIILFGLYRGMWRFFTLRDCFVTALGVVAGALLAAGAILLGSDGNFSGFPRSTLFIAALLLLCWEVGWRGLIRVLREHKIRIHQGSASSARVLLVGNPDEADALLRNLIRYPGKIGQVVGLVSNSKRHHGQQLRGIRIHGGIDCVPELAAKQQVSTILFLPPFNSASTIRSVVEGVGKQGVPCEYRTIPSIHDVATGRITFDEIRKVSIEDLLHRKPHEINFERVASAIQGKRIMVTGAGGSIGSEICRQVLRLNPKSLTLFEISEFLLFEIERELNAISLQPDDKGSDFNRTKMIAITGDVRRADQVRRAIAAEGVDILYHAAAYKHVNLMERNPVACFENNIIGTKTVSAVAEELGVKEFVLISTDKAVRPSSLMGASKRLAERVIIERPPGKTRFKAVRFGNVLGSSGSVVPIFRKQIRDGGPVTVTSREVTRYFMTIPEAVELVIAAGAFTEDSTISVLEMGEAVRIDSLARRMIELSGFVPDVDIPIVYTGLQPGEKEFEELLTDDEGVVRTEHGRIWVVKKSHEVDAPPLDIGELIDLLDHGDCDALREYAHRNVPGSLLIVGSDVNPAEQVPTTVQSCE